MVDIEDVYFEWLLTRLDPDGVAEGVAYLCDLLHQCDFYRRVGNDVNRAADGANLRKEFMLQYEDAGFDPHVTNHLMMMECTFLEMLIALSRRLDFLYEGGVEGRFLELVDNLGLGPIMSYGHEEHPADLRDVETAVNRVNDNLIDYDGHGGLFPLFKDDHHDQRREEIWDQHAAYFREKLEGVAWTSTR